MSPYDKHLDRNAANFQPLTPLLFLERAAAIFPDHIAIRHGALARTYRDFYVMSKHIDDIQLAFEYYTALEIPMTKETFHKVLMKITAVPLSVRVVDLVFAIFGHDMITKELKKGTSFIGYGILNKDGLQ